MQRQYIKKNVSTSFGSVLESLWQKIVFPPKPEVVFKLDKNGDRNQLNLMQRQYIPKFTTLSYLVRSTDYFQINKENKEKSRKIGINRSKMKILKIWKQIVHISGPRVPHAKNQPPRSKTVAYMQITEWRRKWRRRTHFFENYHFSFRKFPFLINERSDM